MDKLKPSEVLKCMQLCGNALTCTTNDHECAYGDEGCMDCVDRLEADIQTLVDAGEDLIIRRSSPENKPLTRKSLYSMNNERVWIQFIGLGMYGIVAYHADPDGDDEDNVYITNNLGGRDTFEDILSQGGTVYARKPEQEAHHEKD